LESEEDHDDVVEKCEYKLGISSVGGIASKSMLWCPDHANWETILPIASVGPTGPIEACIPFGNRRCEEGDAY
jgi:hypothetical protein